MESLYATIHSIVTNQINPKGGQVYFPFLYALFIFILINNLIGMVKQCLGYILQKVCNFIIFKILTFKPKNSYSTLSNNLAPMAPGTPPSLLAFIFHLPAPQPRRRSRRRAYEVNEKFRRERLRRSGWER